MLRLLWVVATLAALSPTVSGGSRVGKAVLQSSLWSGQQDLVQNPAHVADVAEDSASGVTQRRKLQNGFHWLQSHGDHHKSANPKCSQCRIWGYTPSGLPSGHCKKHWRLHTCITNNGGVPTFAPVPFNESSGEIKAAESLIVVLQVPGKGSSEIVAGVACFDGSDCARSPEGLASVNGIAPAHRSGVLTAQCLRGGGLDDDEPGVCMCIYSDEDADDGHSDTSTTSSTGTATSRARASVSGRAAMREGFRARSNSSTTISKVTNSTARTQTSTKLTTSTASSTFYDACIIRDGYESVSLSDDPVAGVVLINNTESGNVTLGVGIGGTERSRARRDAAVAIGEVAPDGLVGFESELHELEDYGDYDYDEGGAVQVDDYEHDEGGTVQVADHDYDEGQVVHVADYGNDEGKAVNVDRVRLHARGRLHTRSGVDVLTMRLHDA